MSTSYWLVKQEPADYPWDALASDGRTAWTGVRNFQARNNLRAMKRGDRVFYYHSGDEKRVVGVARVAREAYVDPTAKEGEWSAVDIEPVQPLARSVTLAEIKSNPTLKHMVLDRNSRLSVSPVTATEAAQLLALAETKL